VDLTIA